MSPYQFVFLCPLCVTAIFLLQSAHVSRMYFDTDGIQTHHACLDFDNSQLLQTQKHRLKNTFLFSDSSRLRSHTNLRILCALSSFNTHSSLRTTQHSILTGYQLMLVPSVLGNNQLSVHIILYSILFFIISYFPLSEQTIVHNLCLWCNT